VKTACLAAGVVVAAALAAGCAHRGPQPVAVPDERPPAGMSGRPAEPVEKGHAEKGLASWYGEPYHGRRTASGEVYDMHRMTAAHRTLPFGTVVEVTRRDTGAEVRVRVNDRGPFVRGRIIDLSWAAAKVIGLDHDGLAPVKVVVVGREEPPPPSTVARGDVTPRPPGGDCVWVQVGAFSDLGNAERAERRLEAAGEAAVIVEGPGGLHRVRVGPFASDRDALEALARIAPDWPEAAAVPCG
jgi:rare lipoprotein A